MSAHADPEESEHAQDTRPLDKGTRVSGGCCPCVGMTHTLVWVVGPASAMTLGTGVDVSRGPASASMGHGPQSSVPPHPSPIEPQSVCQVAHAIGMHDGDGGVVVAVTIASAPPSTAVG